MEEKESESNKDRGDRKSQIVMGSYRTAVKGQTPEKGKLLPLLPSTSLCFNHFFLEAADLPRNGLAVSLSITHRPSSVTPSALVGLSPTASPKTPRHGLFLC